MNKNYTFNIGDRVQFKTWEEMEKEFGVYEHEDGTKEIQTTVAFVGIMNQLCGTTAIITEINDPLVILNNFEKEELTAGEYIFPSESFYFSLDMLKPVEEKGV